MYLNHVGTVKCPIESSGETDWVGVDEVKGRCVWGKAEITTFRDLPIDV